MNHYQNPYRNPYPGQGMGYHGTSHGNTPENTAGQSAGNARPETTANTEPQTREQGQKQTASSFGGQTETGNQKNTGWQNDPSLKNMDLKKLAFLSELVAESGSKPLDALIPFLISANKNANAMGLQFNDAETGLLLEVLKKHMSPEEQSRVDMLRKMADILGKKQ